ncbi:MAG: tagaturonate reductase, partial [Gammaproteobacteria bacterium]|nr:tagaturonate reductase [Gammaproteobacteria bacterium]
DWIIQNANESEEVNFSSNVCVVQPLDRGLVDLIKAQDGLYTTILEGIKDSKAVSETKVINSLSDFINPYRDYDKFLSYGESEDLEFVVSNTTEAGIALNKEDTDLTHTPFSFPGKLLALLKRRYEHFNGDKSKGLDIIACELIDKNGDELKKVILELAKINKLDANFIDWLENSNRFYNSLVDRIVPGYPRGEEEKFYERFGYIDKFMVKGEIFHLWVIEDHYNLESRFPVDKILNVKFVDDVTLYKVRKVKILNGAHTLMVPVSYLYGHDTVGETMDDKELLSFVKAFIFNEVIPTINLPREDMESFAGSVLERYMNPYVHHELMSISLNSITKYKTRVLPTVIDNLERGYFPKNSLYSLAALIVFYRGKRGDEAINLVDNEEFLEFFKNEWDKVEKGGSLDDLVFNTLSLSHWEYDLVGNKKVLSFVTESLKDIVNNGVKSDFFNKELDFIK